MDLHEYKHLYSISADKVLRQVADCEREGWSLYLLEVGKFFILGSGGSAGLHAVLRRTVKSEPRAEQ